MSSEVFKEFLVALGWKVDKNAQREFEDATTKAEGGLGKLKATLEALTVGVTAYGLFKWLDSTAKGLESLYYTAQRAGTSVAGLKAFGFAASQMGSNVEQAMTSAQAFGQWVKNNPMGEAALRGWFGIKTRDANGQLLPTDVLMQSVGTAFARYQPGIQKALADRLGIPLELRGALSQGGEFAAYRKQYDQMLRKAGSSPDKFARDAHAFEVGMRSLGATFEIMSTTVAGSLFGSGGLGGPLQRLLDVLARSTPQLTTFLNNFVTAMIPFLQRLIDWLAKLTPEQIAHGIEGFIVALAGLFALLAGGTMINALSGLAKLGTVLGGLGAPEVLAGLTALVSAVVAINAASNAASGKDSSNFISENAETTGPRKYRFMGMLGASLMGFFGNKDALWAVRNHFGGNAQNHTGDFHRDRLGASAGAGGGPQSFLRNLERQFGLPAGLLDSVWAQESGRGAHMRSSAGAMGHFQFMPATAALYGLKDPMNFAQSAAAAAHMYADLLKANGGNLSRALAAYNWGQGNLSRYGMGRAPAETRDYVRRIQQMMGNPNRGSARDKGGTTLHQTTTIEVHASGDPQQNAHAVFNKQDDANRRLVRNFRTVFA